MLRGEREVLLAGEKRRLAFEELHIVTLDGAQVRQQMPSEFVASGEAEKAREAGERIGIGRQRVGLLIGQHLQPVFDAAQEFVRLGQRLACRRIDPAARGKRL